MNAILMKKILSLRSFFILMAIILLAVGCREEEKKAKREVPAEKKPELNLKIERFDKDLFQLKSYKDSPPVGDLRKNYPVFFDVFTKNVLNIGDSSNPQLNRLLLDFLNDPEINRIKEEVGIILPDLSLDETVLSDAFKNYKFFFPEKTIPRIVAVLSGFNYQNFVTENYLAIGLEFYLGSNHRYYQMLQYPAYKTKQLTKEYITSDAMKSWIITEFEDIADKKNLLSQMIFHGKILYLMDQLMPETEDSLKWGFSANNLAWLEKEESMIWKYLIDKKLLFNNKPIETMKYVNEGPFTPGMPREAPARTALWVGMRIVESYMKKHPDISPAQLMKMKDAATILNQSGYKPL